MSEQVTIAARYNGPPGSANGGYACGTLAAAVGPSAQVRLSLPPPLDVPMTRERLPDGSVRLLHDGATVAEARPGRPDVAPAPAPSLQAAEEASRRYAGRDPDTHAFPSCYVCGPLRRTDGLHVFPGPVDDSGLLACVWRPRAEHASGDEVDPVFVWAALDCPSGFACFPPGKPSVLATMTASVEGPVRPGRPYVVTAWPLGSEGRKHRAASAVHDPDGARVAVAEALWITLREPAA